MMKAIDIKGQKFGMLFAVMLIPDPPGRDRRWLCRCDCGNRAVVLQECLRRGTTKTCGCRPPALTHGHSRGYSETATYRAWRHAIERCENPNCHHYARYGGRGIKVCARWRSSFEAFLEDMGERPTPDFQLDRINNELGYEPGNCRWASRRQNQNNTRRNVFIEAFGERRTISEWARSYGLHRNTLRKRIREGWNPERAITEPSKADIR